MDADTASRFVMERGILEREQGLDRSQAGAMDEVEEENARAVAQKADRVAQMEAAIVAVRDALPTGLETGSPERYALNAVRGIVLQDVLPHPTWSWFLTPMHRVQAPVQN